MPIAGDRLRLCYRRVITATKGESNEDLGNIRKSYGPALQGHEFPLEARSL